MSTRPIILVLRGGSKNHALSIQTGANIVGSLPLYGGEVVDVYIDQAGTWYKNGLPVEPLHTLSHVDAYIDTVSQHSVEKYHELAERLGVERLLHNKEFPFSLNREMIFRVLSQHKVLVPETAFFRKGETVSPIAAKEVFTRMLSPYLVRTVRGIESGVVAHTHKELVTALETLLAHDDVHIMHYRDAKTRSIVAIPDYRSEELYMTLPLEVQVRKYEKPTKEHRLLPLTYLPHEEKKSITDFARAIYEELRPSSVFLIDFITTKRGHMVTGLTTSPNILNGGRFLESLATTGTDVAHYAVTLYEKKKAAVEKLKGERE
jgi:D-alanine-D-alanine ligase-like ATP-grasp enzyme